MKAKLQIQYANSVDRSALMKLPAGDYEATWKVAEGCGIYVDLKNKDRIHKSEDIAATERGHGPWSGSLPIYGLEEGNYYIEAQGWCRPAPGKIEVTVTKVS